MYGFEAPLEGACAYTPQLSRVIEARQLRRSGLIAQDLLALGMAPVTVAAIPQCFAITPFKAVPEALGWLYVVERSRLHHDQVRRHLQGRMRDVARACTYLGVFDDVPDHWQRFGRTLERAANDRQEIATQMIDAAHAGFECMRRWFRRSMPQLRITG
jgi:heme oxygenase